MSRTAARKVMDSAGSLDRARQVLADVFGFRDFRSHQADIIATVISGGDALALMPTGGGKSLCYQIPALVRPGTGIVVSPLIALMQDQVEALTQAGVKAAFLNSTLDYREQTALENRVAAGGLDILYVSPERLLQDRTLSLLDPHRAVAVCHRRGALRLAVGTRLPPRISPVEGARRALSERAAYRAHGNGRRAHARGNRQRAEARAGAALRRQLRPAEHPLHHLDHGRHGRARAPLAVPRNQSMPRMPASSTACRASRSRRRPHG